MPKVSVIVPVYNVEKYLSECLNSIINQTLTDIEIICVDDASPDNSYKILEDYRKKDKRIRVIRHDENQGLGPARNTGLKNAISPFISFIDSDDYIAPEMLATLYNSIKNERADLAIVGTSRVTEDGMFQSYKVITEKNWDVVKLLNCENLYPSILPMWNKLFRSVLVSDIKQLPIISEDLPAIAEYLTRCKRVVTVNKPLYFYRMREGTLSNPTDKILEQWDHFFYSNELFLTTLRNKYSFDALKKMTILRASAIFWRIQTYRWTYSSTWKDQEKKIKAHITLDRLGIKKTNRILFWYLNIIFRFKLPIQIKRELIKIGFSLSIKSWINNKNYFGTFIDLSSILLSRFKSLSKRCLANFEIASFKSIASVIRIFIRNPIWLIGERHDTAQENGKFLFTYLLNNQTHIKCFYILQSGISTFQSISAKKTVIYNSIRHKFLFFSCKYYVTSHNHYCIPTTLTTKKRYPFHKGTKNIFLQHGITSADVSPQYGKNESNISLFICGAKPEYNYVRNQFGYAPNEVVYTGFARFDGLHNYKSKKQVLLMPTWRKEIWATKNIEYFTSSNYYQVFQNLLNNNKLYQMLHRYGYKLIFYPHYEIQPFLKSFSKIDESIVIASTDDFVIQELLKDSALLITDTSSVHFDFAYMFKPVVYYQFDKDSYDRKHLKPGYFDYDKMGFGEVVVEEDTLLFTIEQHLQNNCEMDKLFYDRAVEFYPLHDAHNCKRIFDEIIKL